VVLRAVQERQAGGLGEVEEQEKVGATRLCCWASTAYLNVSIPTRLCLCRTDVQSWTVSGSLGRPWAARATRRRR
jgi:hypothetical protein